LSKTITQQITETMATIQVQVDKTLALVSALELQAAALIGGADREPVEVPKQTKGKAPTTKKVAFLGKVAKKSPEPTAPGTVPMSDQIKQAATALARANSKKQVTVAEVLELLETQGAKMDMQKPNSVIGVTLSRTPGFSKLGSGLYLYQPGKAKEAKAKPEKATKKSPAPAAPNPAKSGDDELEEKCPNCDNPKSQCICQRVQSAMPALSE